MFLLLHWWQATQSAWTWDSWKDYLWPWVSLTWLFNLQLWRHWHWFRKFTVRFRPIRRELESSMYNNIKHCLLLALDQKSLVILFNVFKTQYALQYWLANNFEKIKYLRSVCHVCVSTGLQALFRGKYNLFT